MGWWKVEHTDDLVGDEVYDLVRDATLAVARRYEEEFGRLPTRSEWQRLMLDALQPLEDVDTGVRESLFGEGVRPTALVIETAPLDTDQ